MEKLLTWLSFYFAIEYFQSHTRKHLKTISTEGNFVQSMDPSLSMSPLHCASQNLVLRIKNAPTHALPERGFNSQFAPVPALCM
mmetsp:Transcript_6099/g.12000  ORF Transcript_6099/g.12000 Transcript_6099/m.12000 type:complete len:84 (-) Transcript_6099:1554-1805(-)